MKRCGSGRTAGPFRTVLREYQRGLRCQAPGPAMKIRPKRGFFEMELAGLEPATSWVRYRVREPNRGDLSSLGCSKFSSVRSAALSLVPHVLPRRAPRASRGRAGDRLLLPQPGGFEGFGVGHPGTSFEALPIAPRVEAGRLPVELHRWQTSLRTDPGQAPGRQGHEPRTTQRGSARRTPPGRGSHSRPRAIFPSRNV
jgi:hypothetical protein